MEHTAHEVTDFGRTLETDDEAVNRFIDTVRQRVAERLASSPTYQSIEDWETEAKMRVEAEITRQEITKAACQLFNVVPLSFDLSLL